MAKGQNLSSYQRGIVKRYYENLDTIQLQKLGEMVSDLYLASGKKADGLWTRARAALERMKIEPARIDPILEGKDLEGLARLIGELQTMAKSK